MRYELGKYFGDPKRAKVRFGLSGSIEPTFYSFKRSPVTTQDIPWEGRVFNIDMAIIPMINAKLGKKVFLEFKAIPKISMVILVKVGFYPWDRCECTLMGRRRFGKIG